MAALTKEQVAEFKEIFAFADRDNSVHITAEELMELMTILQIDSSSTEISDMIAELDQDGNGNSCVHLDPPPFALLVETD